MNEKKVEKVLDKIRPYIQRDGGDVTLIICRTTSLMSVSWRMCRMHVTGCHLLRRDP